MKSKEDRFVLKVHKAPIATSEIVRLNRKAMERVREIQKATGFSASQIVSQAVMFAADRLEIEEVE